MKKIILGLFIVFSFSAYSQHNFLGKSQEFIVNYYKIEPEYRVKIDTIDHTKSLITCQTFEQYPYYTYEMDLKNDICISYGFISKKEEVLQAYIDMLDHVGELIEGNIHSNVFIYKIEQSYKTIYYRIKKPFANSEYYSRQKIFFIIVTEELKE